MCMDNCIKRYENKIVLVTGASRGIGAAIAARFAKEGAVVIVNYSGNDEAADRTVENILAANGKAEKYKCQVDSYEETEKMITYIMDKYKRIDILINNAGITKDMLLMRMKPEDFNEVINVNLIGTFNMTKNVINYMMKERKGRIINVSSVVGISGNAGQTNYAASKAGIIGFTKSLAKEVASRNILVNAIAPGFIQTDMTNILKENVKDEIAKTIPLKRMGTAKDVANVVKFLVSEDSSYITGQVIQVDGGMLM